MKRRIISLLLILVTVFFLCSAEASELDGLLGQITSLFSADEEGAYIRGETAEVNDLKVTLTNVYQSKGNNYYKPEKGKEFLMIEFTIENKSKSECTISSVLCFSTWCDDTLCTIDLEALSTGMLSGKPQLDTIIEPNKKFTGIIGYQVDKEWKKVVIEFSPELYFSEKVKFLVENK